jgi:uncharacterized membrane protein HdeD (DUF308 family)
MNAVGTLSQTLAHVMSRAWWMLLLRGLAALIFGLLVVTRPGITLASLVLFFGAYSLVNGVLGLFSAIFGNPDAENRWMLLGGALLSIAIGMLTLWAPGLTALVLLFYIAVWAIATGVLEVAAAFRLRKEIQGEWMLALAGILSICFGLFLLVRPGDGVLAVLSILAFFAIVIGILYVLLAFKVKGIAGKLAPKAG